MKKGDKDKKYAYGRTKSGKDYVIEKSTGDQYIERTAGTYGSKSGSSIKQEYVGRTAGGFSDYKSMSDKRKGSTPYIAKGDVKMRKTPKLSSSTQTKSKKNIKK